MMEAIERLGEHKPSPVRRMTNLYARLWKLKISLDTLRVVP